MADKKFNLNTIWAETVRIYALYQNDSNCAECGRIALDAPQPSLTNQACIDFAGRGASNYDELGIWSRMTTWKLPLVQVVASFPRPPLGFKAEVFVI